MTTDELIEGILKREGGYSNRPSDRGGPTNFGIAAMTLGEWRHLGRPATIAEVKALTVDEAWSIYWARYVTPFEVIPFDELKAQLVDFGVTSGPVTAIKTLQRLLGVPVDGIIGPRTREAMVVVPWRLTNNALVGARMAFYVAIAEKDRVQREANFWGWSRRAISFLV